MRWSDPFEQLSVGERFDSGARTVRDTDVIVFSALTGDWHPQHCDPEWAAGSPFGERIAHGMLVLSLAVGLVPLDPTRVLALRRVSDVVFKRPVKLNETISVSGEITALRPIDASSPEGDASGLVEFGWQIRNQDGALVCRASVQVLWRGDGAADTPAAETAAATGAAAGAAAGEAGGRERWLEPITGGAAPGEFVPLPL
ncbi:MAG TPA: MaoC/PaaZ C-terminal domain-containing protein [Solirubrobacteraceae bacterium]|nr:MaoC/PaaZ C-terminal domain-containing protein [Solirubrobacteraceae bacterium]